MCGADSGEQAKLESRHCSAGWLEKKEKEREKRGASGLPEGDASRSVAAAFTATRHNSFGLQTPPPRPRHVLGGALPRSRAHQLARLTRVTALVGSERKRVSVI